MLSLCLHSLLFVVFEFSVTKDVSKRPKYKRLLVGYSIFPGNLCRW